VRARARELATRSDRPADAQGVTLTPLQRGEADGRLVYSHVEVELDRERRVATMTVRGPTRPAPATAAEAQAQGAGFWPLAVARELEDAVLNLRVNEPAIGLVLVRTDGDSQVVLGYDDLLVNAENDWFLREVRHYLKRVLKRFDLTAKTFFALIEPGSCFAGTLAELVFASDRAMMLIDTRDGDNRPAATIVLHDVNFGTYPMGNGLSRLESRFFGEPDTLEQAQGKIREPVEAEEAEELGLVTFAREDFDWDDELRVMIEERASQSPDALTGMEANLRFTGPESMETKIFGRLTAWQNWIFQRPNAVGEQGALKLYGSGVKPGYAMDRI
jgi:benzoyl-CoA-dihydrodiol lyase